MCDLFCNVRILTHCENEIIHILKIGFINLFQLKLQVPVTSLLLSIRRMNSIFVTAFYIYFRIICKICLAPFDIKNSLSPKDSGSFISLYVRKSSLCRNRHRPVDLLPYKPEADHLHDDCCNPGYRIRQKQESQ